MGTNKSQKPEMPWDQTAFKELKATWSSERIAEDERALKEIFELAADSPLMAEALAWANEHGIKFFIDRKAENCDGYYIAGTGILGISLKYINVAENPAQAVNNIVHELRHAWQDYHGLCNSDLPKLADSPDFSRYLTKVALTEADADAFGRRAADQYEERQENPEGASLIEGSEQDSLKEDFPRWFSHRPYKKAYGGHFSAYYARAYGLDRAQSGEGLDEGNEFNPDVAPIGNGINIDNLQDVLRLGENFSGTENYLAKLQPDILAKQILSPSLADTFWAKANDEQKKLTTELRKAALRRRLAPENRPKRHLWP